MALIFRLFCGNDDCGETVVYRKDKYIHMREVHRGVKFDHKVDQGAIKNEMHNDKEKADV